MISIVAAVGNNYAIGRGGGLPWRLPADLKHFQAVTSGKIIVMGRKTFESLPGVLPDRFHIVLTRNRNYRCEHEQVSVQYDKKLLAVLSAFTELFVIGGAELYREFLPEARRMYLTVLDRAFEADTFFPPVDSGAWVKAAEERGAAGGSIPYRFLTLSRADAPRESVGGVPGIFPF